MWGKNPFWGLTEHFDPDWILTAKQKQLRHEIIELCRNKIRPNAVCFFFILAISKCLINIRTKIKPCLYN